MAFKNFRFQIVIRVILLLGSCTVLAFCLAYHYYLRSYYAGAVLIALTIELIWYVDRFNRDVATFMNSLLHQDFIIRLDGGTDKGKSFSGLYTILNQISDLFRKMGTEKEIQHRYLEMLVAHLQIGILSYDSNEKIYLTNAALKKILQRQVIHNLDALGDVDGALLQAVRRIKAGQTLLVKVKIGNELLQLSIHASEFKLEKDYFKLISIQDIRSELDAREMEAWQKLIRVLTHEIMNSISPISSLSSSLHAMVKAELKENPDQRLGHTLEQGLDAIRQRSEGLHSFTDVYRKLTRVPTPVFKEVSVQELFQRVTLLLASDLNSRGIALVVSPDDALILVDPELMEQVLINLLRNAMDALEDQSKPLIKVSYFPGAEGKFVMQVSDNGKGIDPEIMDNIFVPFFTTKKNGSGIGLALSKQILHLHRAEIKVTSTPGEGTTFTIQL